MNIQQRLFNYEIWLAILLLAMPILLIYADNGYVRPSISDYAYMNNNHIYAVLLTVAATMFSFNGAVWVKNYNIILGISLLGVVLTPHNEFTLLHNIFAALFFLGSCFIMIFFSSKKQRVFKIIAAIIIIIGLLGHFWLNIYSLFIAEWIGITPICIHFIGESKGVID